LATLAARAWRVSPSPSHKDIPCRIGRDLLLRPPCSPSRRPSPSCSRARHRRRPESDRARQRLVAGAQANGGSGYPSLSADGRYVAFTSDASNLVPGDANGVDDVFRRDRLTGRTVRVSVASDGSEANDESYTSYLTAISADGRYVVFTSDASNLVANDTNGVDDVFVRDVTAGTTVRVSVGAGGAEANEASDDPSISADGARVVFTSGATNLVAQNVLPSQVYVRDLSLGLTILASVDSNGAPGDSTSQYPAISGDGRIVAFLSNAHNLAPGIPPWAIPYAFYLHDLGTGVTSLAITTPSVADGSHFAGYQSLSYDGSVAAFWSDVPDLVSGDTNGAGDAFRARRADGRDRARERVVDRRGVRRADRVPAHLRRRSLRRVHLRSRRPRARRHERRSRRVRARPDERRDEPRQRRRPRRAGRDPRGLRRRARGRALGRRAVRRDHRRLPQPRAGRQQRRRRRVLGRPRAAGTGELLRFAERFAGLRAGDRVDRHAVGERQRGRSSCAPSR
jgi:hypothetical protein